MSVFDPERTLALLPLRFKYAKMPRAQASGEAMRRRDFIKVFSARRPWPRGTRAQAERVRRIGVLSALTEDDPESLARRAAFEQALQGAELDQWPQSAD